MLEVSVPNLTKSMGSTVHYNIHIKDGNSQTETTHRYSEFETLHKALVKQFGDSKVVGLPGKKLLGNMSDKFVEERREALEVYLKAICADSSVLRHSEELWEFLGVVPAEVKVEKFVTCINAQSQDPKEHIADIAELSEDPESWPLITSKESTGALVKLCQSVWVKSDAVMSPNITIQEPLCRTMVNLCVEPANRQGLIEAGGFMACLNLLKVVDPQEHRVVKGVLHVVCIMARSETVRGILVGGKAMKQVVALLSEQQPEHVLSAVAMFLWRASCSHEGRSGLIAAGGLQLLLKLVHDDHFQVRILSYLVASALVDELSTQKSADWNTMMEEIEPLLTESEVQASSTVDGLKELSRQLSSDMSVPIDVERLAAMAATSCVHAQLISSWVLSLFSIDTDEIRARVRQGGGQSALGSAIQAAHPLTRKFAARALIELFPGGSAANSVQELGLRMKVADVLLEEANQKDEMLTERSAQLESELNALEPTVKERSQEPQLNKDALHNVIIAVGNIMEMRSFMAQTNADAHKVSDTFEGSCNDSKMRTSILSDESASLQQSLKEVQELCSNSMEICGGADENPEDEAAALIAGRDDLKKQVKQADTEVENLQDYHKQLSGEREITDKQVAQYQLTLDDAPAAKGKLDQLVKQLESDNVALHAKMEENATQTAEVEAEILEAESGRKKAAKKEKRVTSLVETLATMIEMEDESKKKAEELSAMGEQMKSMMEEMAKRQKMMSTMMSQVMAGIGGLNGDEDGDSDEDFDSNLDNDTDTLKEKEEKQRNNVLMLQDRVNTLLSEVKATMTTCDAKLVEARAKLEALKKEKVEIERQLEANRQQIASANQNLEQLQKPEIIQVALKDAEAKMATQDKELAETGKQVAQATQLKNDCQQKFERHIAAMEKLEQMQKDGKALCESWENKMRKHKTKAKKLIAQSSVFNTTVSEIQTRIGEESDQWTEVLKPLIAEAITELQNLHNQLDNK